jgi:putative Mg2+ transporter-C (MgtC) family protein
MGDIYSILFTSDTAIVVFKLLLSLVLAGIIGIERSVMNKPAGFGTFAILGVSACLIVVASSYYATQYDIDAARIPAQVLAGIGFIGAGTIIRNGYNVKGITTAAGIFAVTCIGIAVGIGFYIPACVATLLLFLLISYSHYFTDNIELYATMNLIITIDKIDNEVSGIKQIEEFFKEKKIHVLSISNDGNIKDGKIFEYTINFNKRKVSMSEIIANMISMKEISNVQLVED